MSDRAAYRAFPNAFKRRLLAGRHADRLLVLARQPDHDRGARHRRLRLAAARRRAFAERRHDLHPAADGAEGQRQRAGRAAVVERGRRDQAAARRRLLQLPDSVRADRRRRAPRGRCDALPARRRPRRLGLAAKQPVRHGRRLLRRHQRADHRAGPDREPCRTRRRRRDRRGRRRRWHLRRSLGPCRRARPARRPDPPERAGGDRGSRSRSSSRQASRPASSRRSRRTRAAISRWARPSSPSAATSASSGVRRSSSAIASREPVEPAEHLVDLVRLVEHLGGAELLALDADLRRRVVAEDDAQRRLRHVAHRLQHAEARAALQEDVDDRQVACVAAVAQPGRAQSARPRRCRRLRSARSRGERRSGSRE